MVDFGKESAAQLAEFSVSNMRDPRFKTSHPKFILTINFIEKKKMKKKRPGMAQ